MESALLPPSRRYGRATDNAYVSESVRRWNQPARRDENGFMILGRRVLEFVGGAAVYADDAISVSSTALSRTSTPLADAMPFEYIERAASEISDALAGVFLTPAVEAECMPQYHLDMTECSAYYAMQKSSRDVCSDRASQRLARCVTGKGIMTRTGKKITTCTVDRAAVQSLIDGALVMDWSLRDIGYELNDESARMIGGVAFKLLATRQQGLGRLKTTQPRQRPVLPGLAEPAIAPEPVSSSRDDADISMLLQSSRAGDNLCSSTVSSRSAMYPITPTISTDASTRSSWNSWRPYTIR